MRYALPAVPALQPFAWRRLESLFGLAKVVFVLVGRALARSTLVDSVSGLGLRDGTLGDRDDCPTVLTPDLVAGFVGPSPQQRRTRLAAKGDASHERLRGFWAGPPAPLAEPDRLEKAQEEQQHDQRHQAGKDGIVSSPLE